MPEFPLPPISPLRGLLEVTRLVRVQGELPELLSAVARTIAESLGYETVAVNLYRPAWDDFCVTTVHGNDGAREALVGRVRSRGEWETLLAPEFQNRGAYFIAAGSIDWTELGASYVPSGAPIDAPDAWDPEDALFVPLRHQDGHALGIVSVDEPRSGRRPTDVELDVLVAFAEHAALAVQASQDAAEAVRHRRSLEELLAVSSRINGEASTDEMLRHVCTGIRDALGFQNVSAALIDRETGRIVPAASVGWALSSLVQPLYLEDFQPLLDRRFRREGCYLLPNDEARRRIPNAHFLYASQLNGCGPFAWDRHWLVVPLRDTDGGLLGLIWADDPDDRLLPSADKLQALRIFANDAAAAVISSRHLEELRFLAEHDPLTRLLNRRAFVRRLDGEVARATRYGRSFGLVLCDLDGFKQLNDRHGHAAGDEALTTFSSGLSDALRKPDDAFRIGGDEFAMLLAEATEDDAREVVGRVQRLLSGSGDWLAEMTASFGCASCPDDATDAQTLFRLADQALYEAKRDGSGLHFVA